MKPLKIKVKKTFLCPFCQSQWKEVATKENVMFCKNCGEIPVKNEKKEFDRKS